MEQEKVFANHISDKGLISRIYKELLQLTISSHLLEVWGDIYMYIFIYTHTHTFSLSIHPSIHQWALIFIPWLLWIILKFMGVKVSFWDSDFIFFGHIEMEFLDDMVVQFLIFWGSSTLFSIGAAPFYISPTGHKDPNFSTFLPTLIFSFC